MPPTLSDLIDKALAELPEGNPRELAAWVAQHTESAALRDYYTEAIVDVIRIRIGAHRNATLNSRKQPWKPPAHGKNSQRHTWWQQMCSERVHVGNTDYRLFGDCTLRDVQYCVAEREQDMARVAARRDFYQAVAALMVEHHVDTVKDLPPQAVSALQ